MTLPNSARKGLYRGLFATLACLSACATSSETYVEEATGYAVTRGRIVRVDNLHAERLVPLADGIAITVSQPGCTVELLFEDDQQKKFEVGTGVVLVHGYDFDYILQSEFPARPRR